MTGRVLHTGQVIIDIAIRVDAVPEPGGRPVGAEVEHGPPVGVHDGGARARHFANRRSRLSPSALRRRSRPYPAERRICPQGRHLLHHARLEPDRLPHPLQQRGGHCGGRPGERRRHWRGHLEHPAGQHHSLAGRRFDHPQGHLFHAGRCGQAVSVRLADRFLADGRRRLGAERPEPPHRPRRAGRPSRRVRSRQLRAGDEQRQNVRSQSEAA